MPYATSNLVLYSKKEKVNKDFQTSTLIENVDNLLQETKFSILSEQNKNQNRGDTLKPYHRYVLNHKVPRSFDNMEQ